MMEGKEKLKMSDEKYSNGTKARVGKMYSDLKAKEQSLARRVGSSERPRLHNKKQRNQNRLVWTEKSEGKYIQHSLNFDALKDQNLILDWYYHECLDRVRKNLRIVNGIGERILDDSVDGVVQTMSSQFDELDMNLMRELLIKDGINHTQKLGIGNGLAEDTFGNKFIETGNGKFRSKSEALIAARLDYYGVLYKYEYPIKIHGISFIPDFVIYLDDGSILIWEHMGMLDDARYRNKQFRKIKEYMDAGYFPWGKLILTSETDGKIVDILDVDHKIKRRILK